MSPLYISYLALNWQNICTCKWNHKYLPAYCAFHECRFFLDENDRSGSWFGLFRNLWPISRRPCQYLWVTLSRMMLKLNRQDHWRQSGYDQKIQLLKSHLSSKTDGKNMFGHLCLRLSGRAPQRPIYSQLWIFQLQC